MKYRRMETKEDYRIEETCTIIHHYLEINTKQSQSWNLVRCTFNWKLQKVNCFNGNDIIASFCNFQTITKASVR